MSIHKISLTCLLGIVTTGLVLAQSTSSASSQANPNPKTPAGFDAQSNLNAIAGAAGNGAVVRSFDNRYEGLKGSPLLIEQWIPGEVELNNGNRIINVAIKYDVMGHQLYLKTPKNDSVRLNESHVKQFVLNGNDAKQTFMRGADLNADASLKTNLMRVIYQGKYSLVQVPKKTFQKANYQGAYNAGIRYDEILDESAYYLLRPDGTSEKIKLNRKSVVGALGSVANRVEEYAKTNRVDFKTEADLTKLLTFASTL